MKKICLIVTAISLALGLSLTYAAPNYNVKDVEKFEKTNECQGCDLSNATLKQNHSGANLSNANLSNINIKSAYVKINLSDSILTNTNLSGARLIEANLSGADLTGAHFDGAYVNGANFFGAKGVDLSHARQACDVILPDGKVNECRDGINK